MKKNILKSALFIMLISALLFTPCDSLWAKEKVKENNWTDYKSFRAEVFKLYRQKKYKEAAQLLKKNFNRFPEEIVANAHNLASIYGELKEYKKGIKYLLKTLKNGHFFGAWAFHAPKWEPYKKLKAFDKVLALNKQLIEEAQKKCKYKVEVVTPKGFDKDKKYPLFIALHGAGENLETFKPRWHSPLLSKEFIVAYVQASQVATMEGFHWQDVNITQKDITGAFTEIKAQYPIDEKEIIIGGFSSGGYASFIISFTGIIPVKGFVNLCPPILFDVSEEVLQQAKSRGLRGTIITTAMDPRLSLQKERVELFKKIGLQYQFIVTPNIGHWYPQDLDKKIDLAIHHIRNQ